jgi:hypothetical protein
MASTFNKKKEAGDDSLSQEIVFTCSGLGSETIQIAVLAPMATR